MIKQWEYPIGFTSNAFSPAVITLADNRAWAHATDGMIGRLDPDGSNRDITLEAEAVMAGAVLWFENVGDAGNLVIKNDGGDTVVTIRPRESCAIFCTGTNWVDLPRGLRVFVSAEQTGTGSAQNVAHGLGAVPFYVLVAPTELAADLAAGYDCAEGSHTSTNVVLTVTSGAKFKVLAFG